MKNRREMCAEDLLYFLSAWFRSNKVDLPIDKTIDLTSMVFKCFDDDRMFDSWFLGMDVMS